ncbi:hypothetical protein NU271_04465 [Limosilactobacillus reuteri]
MNCKIKDKSNKLTLSALGRSIIAPGILSIKHGGLLSDEDKASRSRNRIHEADFKVKKMDRL